MITVQKMLEYPCFRLLKTHKGEYIVLQPEYRALMFYLKSGYIYRFDDGTGTSFDATHDKVIEYIKNRFHTKGTYFVRDGNAYLLIFPIPRNCKLHPRKRVEFGMVKRVENTEPCNHGEAVIIPYEISTEVLPSSVETTEEVREPIYPYILLYSFDNGTHTSFISTVEYSMEKKEEKPNLLSTPSFSSDISDISDISDDVAQPQQAPAAQQASMEFSVPDGQVITITITITLRNA